MTNFRVALVYPPFGPSGLPSLGLGLLSAGLTAQGVPNQVFYWNLEVLATLPFTTLAAREAAYRSLTTQQWFPFNEWVFAHLAYDDSARLPAADTDLLNHALVTTDQTIDAALLLEIRAGAAAWVNSLVDRLAGFAVVGIASTFYQHVAALALARAIKQRMPDVHVVIGGANVDDEMGRATLDLFPAVDSVLGGEADFAFLELAARLADNGDLGTVAGLHWRTMDKVGVSNAPIAPISELDRLPIPDFTDYLAARETTGLAALHPLVLALESSRGCWWGAKSHCTFCGLNANGMAHRSKTPDRFFTEIDAMRNRYDARYVFMADNILDMRYYDALVQRAERSDVRLEFFYEIKSNAKRTHVARLAKAGVTAVQPGIEHFSSEVLRLMRKGVTGAQNVAFLKYAHDEGVLPIYNLLVNFPGELADWHASIVTQIPRLAHLRPPSSTPEVEFHRFSPYHRNPAAFGIDLQPLPAYATLYPFAPDQLSRLAYRFYNAGAQQRQDFAPLIGAVAAWHAAYADGAALAWWREHDQIVIRDTRPGFGPRTVRLAGWATCVFELLDEPRSLPTLVDAARRGTDTSVLTDDCIVELCLQNSETDVIAFNRQAFIDDPQAALELFDSAGLIFADPQAGRETLYVSLPLRNDHPPLSTQWLHTGV